ncbi:MAG TPA: hypothetical protein VGB83_10575 [Actinomycetota bacterium]
MSQLRIRVVHKEPFDLDRFVAALVELAETLEAAEQEADAATSTSEQEQADA